MNSKHLILATFVSVLASTAVAAIKYGHPEARSAWDAETAAIPRVVVTAGRVDVEVPRIVVVARRADADQVLVRK
jgi:hypothetical protein